MGYSIKDILRNSLVSDILLYDYGYGDYFNHYTIFIDTVGIRNIKLNNIYNEIKDVSGDNGYTERPKSISGDILPLLSFQYYDTDSICVTISSKISDICGDDITDIIEYLSNIIRIESWKITENKLTYSDYYYETFINVDFLFKKSDD